jgi:hypothetical protein
MLRWNRFLVFVWFAVLLASALVLGACANHAANHGWQDESGLGPTVTLCCLASLVPG